MTFLRHYQPPDLQLIADEDVGEATDALAATFETSARGVIYDHQPASLPAARLAAALKPVVAKAGGSGAAFERDAAAVLRRIGESVRDAAALEAGKRSEGPGSAPPATPGASRRAFLDWLGRVLRENGSSGEHAAPEAEASRLVLP